MARSVIFCSPFCQTRIFISRKFQADPLPMLTITVTKLLRKANRARARSFPGRKRRLRPSHGLATGADCDPAKGHDSIVRYPLADLARGACPEADSVVTRTRETKNVSGSRRHLPLFVSAIAASRSKLMLHVNKTLT